MVRSAGAELGTRSRIGLTPSRVRRFQTNSVVDCVSEPLFATEVSFSRLNTDMTEQKLDLFELSARIMAQTGAGATKIVRRNPIQTAFQGSRLHDAPDHLRTECARADTLAFIDRAKNRTRRDTGGSQPAIHRALDPNRHWHSAHVSAFADEIRDHPVLFSLLDVFHGKPGKPSGGRNRAKPRSWRSHVCIVYPRHRTPQGAASLDRPSTNSRCAYHTSLHP